jgi:hypothetical protein
LQLLPSKPSDIYGLLEAPELLGAGVVRMIETVCWCCAYVTFSRKHQAVPEIRALSLQAWAPHVPPMSQAVVDRFHSMQFRRSKTASFYAAIYVLVTGIGKCLILYFNC